MQNLWKHERSQRVKVNLSGIVLPGSRKQVTALLVSLFYHLLTRILSHQPQIQ